MSLTCPHFPSTLQDLPRYGLTVEESVLGQTIAAAFQAQADLPGVVVLQANQDIIVISRRRLLERLSQPYGLELFMKRPIRVFLSVASLQPPLVLGIDQGIDVALQAALHRTPSELYEPIVVHTNPNIWELLDFQTLILTQNQLLFQQQERLRQQAQRINTLNEQLLWQANHDPLTQLMNRRAFEQHLQALLQGGLQSAPASTSSIQEHKEETTSTLEQPQATVLCYIDLDRFKIINDTCGHGAGDELLRQVAALFINQCRKTDIISRIGGDEFAILLQNCSLDQARQIIGNLQISLHQLRFSWENRVFTIGASIGVYPLEPGDTDLQRVMAAADSACYYAKHHGTNHFYVYQPDHDGLRQELERKNSIAELNTILEEERLALHLQPIAALQTNTTLPVSSAHAVLLRFLNGHGDLLSPKPLIEAAERYKLIHLLDRWVLKTLCRHYHSSQPSIPRTTHPPNPNPSTEEATPPSLYTINLSGASFKDETFVAFVRDLLQTYQVPPSLICFEITEAAAMTHFTRVNHVIKPLKALGCQFALDNFGSGLASFHYLKQLQVDFLKIDRQIIQGLIDEPVDRSIVSAIQQVANCLGLFTIAQGVDNPQIIPIIQDLGVHYFQGFALAAPYPLKQLKALSQPGNTASLQMIQPAAPTFSGP